MLFNSSHLTELANNEVLGVASKMKTKMNDPVKQEYATKLTLIGIFLTMFATFVSRLSFWRRERGEFILKPFDLALLGLATMRLGRLVAYDRVAEPLRQPFAQTVPDRTGAGETVEPRGSGVQQSLGQLISCPICSGTWIAAGLVYGLHTIPSPTRVFLAIMGTTGVAEILNALTEALSWIGQLARKLSGEKEPSQPVANLFNSGGNYYVGHDHEKYYSQGGR